MHPEKDMRLHCGIGPNSYRVRIFMAEKGIDVPRVDVDLTKAEHKSPDFLKLNSLGQIPVLELDDGSVITESVAICRYIEELHPTPALFGGDAGRVAPGSRCGTAASSSRCSARSAISRSIRTRCSRSGLSQFPAFAETQREAVPGKWAWLDRELSDGRAFLAGDQFSIADITGGVAAWLGGFFAPEIPASLANVHRWLGRVHERPSWSAA